jgi:ethanolamine utilization protein EutQ (cupin superfamily)
MVLARCAGDNCSHNRQLRPLLLAVDQAADFYPQEEVYEVIEGELEVTIDGVAQIARSGVVVAIVPGNVRHSVKALTDGRAIIVDYPLGRV